MRIESLVLRDIGPFEKEKFVFSGNLIGIVGPNGSGKSTLIETVLTAWAGIFRKFDNLADFVRDLPGGGKASSGSVQSTGVHNGCKMDVRRTVTVTKDKDGHYKGSQAARLKFTVPGQREEEVKGVKLVDAKLREIIGEDLTLMAQFAFIEQNQTSAIVDSDPSTRSKALHRLFGLDRYEKTWEMLGEELRGVPEIQTAESVSELTTQHDTAKQESFDLNTRVVLRKRAIQGIDLVVAERAIQVWEGSDELRDKITRSDESVRNAEVDLSQKLSQRAVAETEVKRLDTDLSAIVPKADIAEAFLKSAGEVEVLRSRKTKLESEAYRIATEVRGLQAPQRPQQRWNNDDATELREKTSMLQVSTDFIAEHRALTGKAICPTCGQEIKDLAAELEKHRQKIDMVQPRVTQLGSEKDGELAAFTKYDLDKSVHETKLASLGAEGMRISGEHKVLVSHQDTWAVYTDEACAEQRTVVSERDGLKGSLLSANDTLMNWEEIVGVAVKTRDESKTARSALQTSLKVYSEELALLTPDAVEKHRATVKMSSDKRIELARLEEEHRGKLQELRGLETRLERAKGLEAQIDRVRRVKETLQSARDVFHREQLPSVLARRFVAAIDSQVQHFLSLMQSEFTAGLEQEDGAYRFRCIFDDSSERDASCLSGGEKVRFSISFLLAVNEVLAAKLGTLALDEPTAHLDDENIQHFIDVLAHVQQYAQSAGVQIFLITHSSQLLGSFDQAISLAKGKQLVTA